MVENKLPYDKLLNFIDRIGSIETIVKNPDIIRAIIAFDTDRHLLCALIDRINEVLESGKVLPEELTYFRSGMLMDDIVNLERTIKNYGRDKNRELYVSEILDKVNYVSLLRDSKSLSACYTHPVILDALCGKQVSHSRELIWWSTCGTFITMPPEVQTKIIALVLEKGGYEEATKLAKDASSRMPEYQVNNTFENNNRYYF